MPAPSEARDDTRQMLRGSSRASAGSLFVGGVCSIRISHVIGPAVRRRMLWAAILVACLGAPGVLGPASTLAQGCSAEVEPNDAPESAPAVVVPGCMTGVLPKDDLSDHAVWTIEPDQAAQGWSIAIGSPEAMPAAVALSRITSDTSATTLVLDPAVVMLRTEAGATEPTESGDLFLRPGRYLVSVSPGAPWSGTATSYRVDIGSGRPWPASADQEPNDDLTLAVQVGAAFEQSGDAAGTDDYFAWQVPDIGGPGLWTLEARSAIGTSLALALTDADGAILGDVRSEPDGTARMPDLRLAPGPHSIRIVGTTEASTPYILRAYREDLDISDPEPNDDPAHALPIIPGELMTGRLSRPSDWDAYRLTVDEALGSALIDTRLIVQTGPPRRLCLYRLTPSDRGLGEESLELSCSEGPDGATLDGLLLQPGDYELVVAGTQSLVDPYYLRVDTSASPQGDFELEPNDTPALATPMTAGVTMRGRLDTPDHFRVHVEGEPQLWQVEARGHDARLVWVRTDGYAQGIGTDPDGNGERSVITDAYLIPGDHWFRLDGSGEYALALEALGPPVPGGEREPNDALALANTLPMDGSVTGRVGSAADRDVYRFSLAGPEHVKLTLRPPPGETLQLYASGDTAAILSYRQSQMPGQPVELDLVLPGGDHAFEVVGPVSEDRYRLSLERQDPFDLAEDQEPNDEATMAVPMPPSLRVTGTTDAGDAADWYRLDPLPAAGELSLRTEGKIDSVIVDDGLLQTPLLADADGVTFRSPPLLAGATVALGVSARGPYAVDVDPGTTGLVAVAGDADTDAELPVRLSLEPDRVDVAAFEVAGQRVPGRLTIANDGDAPIDLRLDAVTSDPEWTVELDSTEVSVAAGASTEVPMSIVVPAQAWVGRSVRSTVRASADSGQVTAHAEITPSAGAPLVDPSRWWGVPDTLLGGLDAASTGLGAVPLVSIDPVAEAALHDGMVALTSGMALAAAPPQTLMVDLAGDEPVPVVGTILDPTAGPGAVAGTVRDFELLLSIDGTTYEHVLGGELSGALTDQAFVLPEATPARFAQLRITSRYPGADELRLGEWKVVATPGWTPTSEPLDIAAPAIGGHVAWFDPQAGSPDMLDAMLIPDAGTPLLLGFDARETSTASWAIGFQDGRAAQVTEIQWIDSPGSRPELRLSRVELASSMDGPLGPWTPLGTWALKRDDAGEVAPLRLEEPTWMRYVRMSGSGEDSVAGVLELPDAIRILERGASETYRPVAGEWGYATPAGSFEWQQPVPDTSDCLADEPSASGAESDVALGPGEAVHGCVARGETVDAYVFRVPADQHSVRFTVSGRPTVGVGLALLDQAGAEVSTATTTSDTPGAVDLLAAVTPGASYRLLVEQPPFSVVVLFDTSGSVGAFIPIMASALRSYLGGIVTGEEALQLFDLEGPPLPEEFTDDPWLILNALDAHAGSQTGSSSAEIGVLDGLDALAAREGTRAVFLMTDAETSSFHRQAELWRWLGLVEPRVFTMQVGGFSTPRFDERTMQDWAAVGSGAYDVTRAGGDIERAFDRMAAWLRRPANYGLVMAFSPDRPPEPELGTLKVVSDPNAPIDAGTADDARASRTEADVAVEVVLDTSGSMLERLGRKRRIDVAKNVLAGLVAEQLEPGTPVALRVFRQERRSCETELAVPLSPLDATAMGATIEAIEIDQTVKTPLAAAIAAVADDLASVTGPRIVIVISDGQESCDGDPEAAVRSLVDEGFDVSVNVVGLDLDRKTRRRISKLAAIGGGGYYDARDAVGLADALKVALGAPYVVLDATGAEVRRGTVDGPTVELPPGTYRISLAGAEASFDAVVIESGVGETVIVPATPGS